MATLILLLTACATVVRRTFDQIRQGTIRGIAETPITLRDGVWVGPEPTPGGASALHVTLWNEPVAFLDIIEAGPGDALCCPSRFARKTYALQGSALVPVAPRAHRQPLPGRPRRDPNGPS